MSMELNVKISDENMRKIKDELLAELESSIERKMNLKFSSIENSLIYIVKLLMTNNREVEDSDMLPEFPSLSWQEEMVEVIKHIVRSNPVQYPNCRAVLKQIQRKMRNVYGIVSEQLRKDYKEKWGIENRVETLDAIADNEDSKKIFESILYGMVPESASTNIEKNNFSIEEDEIREMIRPLAERNEDKSKGWNRTFRLVYSKMDCSWNGLKRKYQTENRLKNEPRKIKIVCNNEKVFKEFKACVESLLDAGRSG